MSWWKRAMQRRRPADEGERFQVVVTLFSADGQREAEVRRFEDERIYLLERERHGDEIHERHGGALVGPFVSPEAAEAFIVQTTWFKGLA